MRTRTLASLIERYLEGDEDELDDPSDNSTSGGSNIDHSARLQLRQLTQRNTDLQREMASLRNNIQMLTLLPLLTPQSVRVTQHTPSGPPPRTSLRVTNTTGTHIGDVTIPPENLPDLTNDTMESEPSDSLSSLLPILLLGGLGGSGNGESDSSNPLVLALLLSGSL